MRYLVTARVKPGREAALLKAIEDGSLGSGSVAGDEYLRNMSEARLAGNGRIRWVEVCFCDVPLDEERPYWEEYFDLVRVQDAHARHRCRDLNGEEPWACGECDCTVKLEKRLADTGPSFVEMLKQQTTAGDAILPESLYPVGIQGSVIADQRNPLHQCLRDK